MIARGATSEAVARLAGVPVERVRELVDAWRKAWPEPLAEKRTGPP